MKLFKTFVATTIVVFCLCLGSQSQRKPYRKLVNISQFDPRFTISLERYWSSLGGSEEYYYYVKNNTQDEYKMVITVTIDLACVGTKTYPLGVNKVVYLKPNGEFTAEDDDWVHIVTSGADNNKTCRLKDGDSFTVFKSVSYRVTDIINITQQKTADAKKKEDDGLKAKQVAEAKKQEDEKLKTERLATAKKQEEEKLKATKADELKKTEASALTTKKPNSVPRTSQSEVTEDIGSSSETKRKTEQEKQLEAKREADRAERERVEKEQEQLKAKQQNYDAWNADKKKEQSTYEATAMASSFTLFTLLGGILYENMGNVDPDFVYKGFDKKTKFYAGIEMGLSATTVPLIFASDFSTYQGGKPVLKKELQAKSPIMLNLNLAFKMGLENEKYSAFAYVAPNAGISPVFDATSLSLLVAGIKADAGIKWVKAYVDYEMGGRAFTMTSNDAEENGNAKSDYEYTRITYGVKFTTKPNSDFCRNHFYLGLITETIKTVQDFAIYDYNTKSVNRNAKSKPIQGYAFQFKKDHNFKLFANVFPEYNYTGQVLNGSGSESSDLQNNKGNFFVELGFLRSIDWWM